MLNIKCQPTYSAILKFQDGILPYCPNNDYFSEMIILYCLLLIVTPYFLKAKSALKLCEMSFSQYTELSE